MGDSNKDYVSYKDMLQALTVYRVDLGGGGRQVTKDDYVNMAKFLYIQICQQAEMSIHLKSDQKATQSSAKKPSGAFAAHGRRMSSSNTPAKDKKSVSSVNTFYETQKIGS